MKTIIHLHKSIKLLFIFPLSSLLVLSLLHSPCYSDNWPTALHDVSHTGTSLDTLALPLKLKIKKEEVHSQWYPYYGKLVAYGDRLNVTWLHGLHICYDINTLESKWSYFSWGVGYNGRDHYPAVGGNNNEYVFVGGGHGGVYQLEISSGAVVRAWSGMDAGFGASIVFNGYYYPLFSSESQGSNVLARCLPYPGYNSDMTYSFLTNTFWGRSSTFEMDTTYPFLPATYMSWMFNTPCIGGNTLFMNWDGIMHGINPETGYSNWSKGKNMQYSTSAAYENGKVFVAGTEGFTSTDDFKKVHQGIIYCLDAKTGEDLWSYTFTNSMVIDNSTNVGMDPIVSNGTVYFGSNEGYYFALDASNGTLKWKTRVEGSCSDHNTSAISGDIVYFGTAALKGFSTAAGPKANNKGWIYALNKNTGVIEWSWNNPDQVSIGPVIIANKKLIATGINGYIYVFEEDAPGTDLVITPKTALPGIVQSGTNFTITCKGNLSDSGWNASLVKYNTTISLTISASYDVSKGCWIISASIPSSAKEGMYDLSVGNNIKTEKVTKSVKVINIFKTDYYYVHITNPSYSLNRNDLNLVLDQVKIINPEFVLISGNLTGNGDTQLLQCLVELLKSKDIPVFVTPGEMDCYGGVNSDTHKSYETNVGPRYFSFSYGNHKYLGVDTTDDNGKIGSSQIDFIRNELRGTGDLKSIFYYKDNMNQIPALCDELGINAALSYGNNSVTNSGLTPTKYVVTPSCIMFSDAANSGYFRVVKVSNNKVVFSNLLGSTYYGAYRPAMESVFTTYYDGKPANDGISSVNAFKVKNHSTESFDNCFMEILMPYSSSYVAHNAEVIRVVDKGNGKNLVTVKFSMDTGSTTYTTPYVKPIHIGTLDSACVTYYSDTALLNEISEYQIGGLNQLPTRKYLKEGRTYFKIFIPSGDWASYKLDQQGAADILSGQTEKLDGTGLIYKGYYDVVRENGTEYKDGEANMSIISSGKVITPDIGNLVTIKTGTPEPYFKYCSSGSTGVTISGEAIQKIFIDYYWNYNKGVDIYRKTIPSGSWQVVYTHAGTGLYFTYNDTNIVTGTNYRYKLVQRDALNITSLDTDEYEVTAGSFTITSPAAVSITTTGAIITWTTSVSTTSQVEYAAYAGGGYSTFTYTDVSRLSDIIVTSENSSLVTAHSVTISGLKCSTTYGYRVISKTIDGKINTYGGIKYPILNFATPANSSTVVALSAESNVSAVYPGDACGISVYGLDNTGKRAGFALGSTINYQVISGGGVVNPASTTNSYTTVLTAGSNEGINQVAFTKTGATAGTISISAITPDHYKFTTPLTITAGGMVNITITAYSDAAETTILPITTNNINLNIKAVAGDNPSNLASTLLLNSISSMTKGVGFPFIGYTKAETNGIRIKAEDVKGKTGLSDVITVLADSTKPSKLGYISGKEEATSGETVTITGSVLDIYGNQIKTGGTVITFTRIQGAGTLSGTIATTDSSGGAAVGLTLISNEINVVELTSGSLQKVEVIVRTNTIGSLVLTPESYSVKAGTRCNIFVETKDAGGNAAAGISLKSSITSGGGNLESSSVITDNTGKANIGYIGSTVPGVTSIKVETLNSSVSSIVNLTIIVGDIDHYAIVTPDTSNINTAFSVVVTAKDRYENTVSVNNDISISVVPWNNTYGTLSGTLSITNASLINGSTNITNATYDITEKIKIKAKDSNNKEGYSGVTDIKSGAASQLLTVLRKVYTVTGSSKIYFTDCPEKCAAGSSVDLITYVKDADMNSIGGSLVTYSSSAGTLAYSVITSDSYGMVKNSYTAASGSNKITIICNSASTVFTIQGLTPNSLSASLNPAVSPSVGSPSMPIVTVKDASGITIPFAAVNCTVISGSGTLYVQNTDNITQKWSGVSSMITDKNGAVVLSMSGLTVGVDTVVRLTCSGIIYNLTFQSSNNQLSNQNSATMYRGISGSIVKLGFILRTQSYAGVPGKTTNFTITSGGGSLSNNSGVTDSSGLVYTYLTLPAQEGNVVISASCEGLKTDISATSINGSIGISCSPAVIVPSSATQITVNLFDLAGKIIKSEGNGDYCAPAIINFSTTPAVGSLSIVSGAPDMYTGMITLSYTASGTAQDVDIIATSGSVSGTLTLKVAVVSSIEANADPLTVLTNSGSSSIKAIVKEVNGYPVSNAAVTYSLISGTGSLSLTTAVTNREGAVISKLQNVTSVGDNVVRVSSNGISKDITIKSVGNLIGYKVKLVAPSTIPYLIPTTSFPMIYYDKKDVYGIIVDNLDQPVSVSGTTVTLKSTGGTFKYSASGWQSISTVNVTTDIYGKAYVSNNATMNSLNFYPTLGLNTVTASVSNLGSATVTILGSSVNPYSFDIKADPSGVKPNSNCKITAVMKNGGAAIVGEGVNFSMLSVEGVLSTTTGTTDMNGEAAVILSSTNSTNRNYIVQASCADLGLSNVITVTTAQNELSAFNLTVPESVINNQVFEVKIKACDINGGPVILATPVTITVSAVKASDGVTPGSGVLSVGTAIISNNADSSVTLSNVTYTDAEEIKIKVSVGEKSGLSSKIILTKQVNNITATSDPSTCIAGQAVVINGVVKDIDGKGVSGQAVTVVSSGGTLDKSTSTTDIDGKVCFILITSGATGITSVTITSSAITGTASVTTTGVIASYTVAAPATADISGFSLSVTAKDAGGNIVKSSPVAVLSLAAGTGTLGITSVRLVDGTVTLTETYSKVESGVRIKATDVNGKTGTTGVTINMTNSMPQVLSLAPAAVSNISGGTIQITGKNYFSGGSSSDVTNIRLNDTGSTVLTGYSVTSDTVIVSAIVPTKIKAGSYDVLITTSKGTSAGGAKLTVTTSPPVLSSITPNSCVTGETKTISIAGSGFYAGTTSADVRALKVGATTITAAYIVASDTAITGVIIPGTLTSGTYNVVATTGGGDSSGVSYTVSVFIPVPAVAGISPVSGYRHVTNTLNISGNGYFGGSSSNSVSSVQLVGTSTVTITTYNVVSDVSIQNAIVPAGIAGGTYNLKVTTAGGTSLTTANTKYVALVDAISPTVLTVTANISQVKVTFSEDMTLSAVTNKANYTIQSPTGTGNVNLGSTTISYSGNMVTIGNLSLTADATFTTTVSNVTDLAGNAITGASVAGVVQGTDLTGPTNCSIVINGGVGYTGSTNVTLTLSATDANSGMGTGAEMQFSNTGTTWVTYAYATTSVWTLDAGTGTKAVSARFSDALGNWSVGSVTDTIVLDTTGPANCSIIINSGDEFTNNTSVNLTLSAADADSGLSEMRFSNDGSIWTTAEAYSITKSYPLSVGDGPKIVYAQFKDNAGNWSGSIAGNITLDTLGPVGSIDINSGALYTKSAVLTLILNAADEFSGINQMQFMEGTGSWSTLESYTTGTKIFTVTNTDELKTITVRYTDNLSNSSTYSKNIKLCTVTKLEVLSQIEAVAGESIIVTIRAVREEGINSTLITGYLNMISFNVKDLNAATLPDYTFAGTDSGVKQVMTSLKTLGDQEIEVSDKDIEGISGKVKVKVYAAIAADGTNGTIITNADGTSIDIPAGAFSGNKEVGFKITENPKSAGTGYRYKETVKPVSRDFGELNRTTSPWQFAGMTFSTPVKISVPYKPEEVGDVDENSLRLFYYDETSGKYIIVPGKQTVSGGKITAQVNHFSTYRILGTYVSSNLNNVIAYPNPYKPSTAVDGKMKIINLPVDCTATIYNIAGEKIKEIKESDLGNLGWIDWDGKNDVNELVARGVYLYVIKAPDGSKKIGKVGLIK
ncbi:MAG: hypothetical protein A2452_11575 [Candidatus Firestonebacteria bacterium RIFOXYC2_FULL_39_67]|nr:MAG: hypothetical protein A2536_01850 [Candidatus Firestonebacteria bacterium RIFOXYD2_FULL_39_29]OGF53863.1 MAG: hypothetical protein A2452_11575 [Candidatus Firestonebacteria bacterium RIFOXYC2_FULL_39_67]